MNYKWRFVTYTILLIHGHARNVAKDFADRDKFLRIHRLMLQNDVSFFFKYYIHIKNIMFGYSCRSDKIFTVVA
jgi:hypothetical protein